MRYRPQTFWDLAMPVRTLMLISLLSWQVGSTHAGAADAAARG